MHRFSDPIQMRARMTNEATGMDFIRAITGESSSFKKGRRKAAVPRRRPAAKARRNPRMIFPEEQAMVFQKSAVTARETRVFSTSTGPVSSMELPTSMLAACQRAAQNRRIAIFRVRRKRSMRYPSSQKQLKNGMKPPEQAEVSYRFSQCRAGWGEKISPRPIGCKRPFYCGM